MIKRTPSRNTRSKGFKGKHVLQIFLLLGVCFWLLYQVKHSHDKKKEFEEKDAKITVLSKNVNSVVDFGRKGLHPHLRGVANDEKHEEDDEGETLAEEEVNKVEEIKHEEKPVIDENKHKEQTKTEEDDEREEVNKNDEEERDNDGKWHGEEERENDGNEHGEAKTEEGNGHDEEEGGEEEGNGHDEEEREEGNGHDEEEREKGKGHDEEEREDEGNGHDKEEREKGSQHEEEEREKEGRGGGDDEIDERDQQKIEEVGREDGLVEEKEREEGEVTEKDNHEASTEDQDYEGGTQDNHEVLEVHYQADDASSAVTHDTQNVVTEPEKISSDRSNENPVISDLGLEKNSSEINHNEITEETINTRDQLLKNSNADQQLSTDNLSDVKTEASEGISITSKQNKTLVTFDLENPHNLEASNLKTTETEQVSNYSVSGATAESNSTSTGSDKMENSDTVAKETTNAINSEPDGSNKTIIPEITEAEVNSRSTRNETQDVSGGEINETQDASQGENSDIENESNGTDENSHRSEADVHDQTDSSIGQDVKDAHINMDTPPEDVVDGVNSRDTAAE